MIFLKWVSHLSLTRFDGFCELENNRHITVLVINMKWIWISLKKYEYNVISAVWNRNFSHLFKLLLKMKTWTRNSFNFVNTSLINFKLHNGNLIICAISIIYIFFKLLHLKKERKFRNLSISHCINDSFFFV